VKGRKPKPAGLSTRRPQRDEGVVARLPACPAHLQGEARKKWQRTGRKLRECGLVTEIDGAALALYCQAWERWVEAEAALKAYGVVIKSPSGFPIQSPYLAVANKAMEQMAKQLVEFGMSPSSRTRVAIAPQPHNEPPPRREEPGPDPREILRMVPR
jgi:P27 family predicted phage terminase small subunit